jgi:hypothetical protein
MCEILKMFINENNDDIMNIKKYVSENNVVMKQTINEV